jgi:MFS family permease
MLVSCRYFLTLTSFQPLYGRLSDIFGRKAALLFAYAVFGTGCLFCGLARNMIELVAARVCGSHKYTHGEKLTGLQAFSGIGGGGMTTVVSITLSDIIPLRDRGLWQGIINIVYASGAAAGAPLGSIPCPMFPHIFTNLPE